MEKLVALARSAGCVYVATSDTKHVPHVATAGHLHYDAEKDVMVLSDWFCPQTVANLHHNGRLSVVAWDRTSDLGYQLQGRVSDVHNTMVLDGYAVGEAQHDVPQVRKDLLIKVDKISEFSHAAHSDEDLLQKQKGAAL